MDKTSENSGTEETAGPSNEEPVNDGQPKEDPFKDIKEILRQLVIGKEEFLNFTRGKAEKQIEELKVSNKYLSDEVGFFRGDLLRNNTSIQTLSHRLSCMNEEFINYDELTEEIKKVKNELRNAATLNKNKIMEEVKKEMEAFKEKIWIDIFKGCMNTDTQELQKNILSLRKENEDLKKQLNQPKAVRYTGRVTHYNTTDGYGHIQRTDNKGSIYFHNTGITQNDPYKILWSVNRNQMVEFDLVYRRRKNKNRYEAINVTGPKGAPVKGEDVDDFDSDDDDDY